MALNNNHDHNSAITTAKGYYTKVQAHSTIKIEAYTRLVTLHFYELPQQLHCKQY